MPNTQILCRHRLPPLSCARRAWVPVMGSVTLAFSALLVSCAVSAQTQGRIDIAPEPLITMSEAQAKPNMMILLDDSLSMSYDYMPDAANYGNNLFGRFTAQCNGVYYNPEMVYEPPIYADGSAYPDAIFEAALMNGFAPLNTNTVNLATNNSQTVPLNFQSATQATTGTHTFDVQSGSTQALGHLSFASGTAISLQGLGARNMSGIVTDWIYNPDTDRGLLSVNISTIGGGTLSAVTAWSAVTTGQFYYQYRGTEEPLSYAYTTSGTVTSNLMRTQCSQNKTAARNVNANTNLFESVSITSTSDAATKTNYANWYSYYRTRELMMRTAMGKAISQLDDSYRVGFMTINKTDISQDRLVISSTGNVSQNFRNIEDFTPRKKADIYDSLYKNTTGGITPLRRALSRAGQYYANKATRQSYDPLQYACQRNYVMLTTDGYWNSSAGQNLTGGSIGNADGNAPPPMGDTASNTLADVAYYYYSTDLRTPSLNNCISGTSGINVCENIVPPNERDDATHQHMTTFTIGLGVNGTLPFSKTYLTDTTGTYIDIVEGRTKWPTPIADLTTTIDDLWHAAINGRGAYYSAQNASELAESINGVIASIQQSSSTASATSTNTLDLVQGENNIAYEASYTTVQWSGDVQARTIDATTGMQDTNRPALWSARTQLDSTPAAQRQIYFNNAGALTPFTLSNVPDGQKNWFLNHCATTAASQLSQCQDLSPQAQALINQGDALIQFLRGDRSNEYSNRASALFRTRASVLGDIVNSKPIHIGAPALMYEDVGYAEFKQAQANRKRVIYVGANDGMLHALDAATGQELWAYIPTAVMPNLYKLADNRYGTVNKPHQYFVDGQTVQGDVYINNQWRTILVGGLNSGGRAYYALDITSPERPLFLWEFSDTNLGLSFSEPVISKLQNGLWTVAFGSGYNNASPGDNRGRLFIVDAATGQLQRNIATSAGSTTQTAGLAKINVWRTSNSDNTAERFYAGDLLGNIWRFDVDRRYAPFNSALLLAQMRDANGLPQPISTEIQLRNTGKTTLAVATGQYLGTTDIIDNQTQSFAVFEDPLEATGLGILRNHPQFKQQSIDFTTPNSQGQASSTATPEANLLRNNIGWWADFPTAGERVSIPMAWLGSTLIIATAIPEGDVCKSGGSSWLYSVDIETGQIDDFQFSDAMLIVGISVVYNSDGLGIALIRDSTGSTYEWSPPQPQLVRNPADLRPHRISWRELY